MDDLRAVYKGREGLTLNRLVKLMGGERGVPEKSTYALAKRLRRNDKPPMLEEREGLLYFVDSREVERGKIKEDAERFRVMLKDSWGIGDVADRARSIKKEKSELALRMLRHFIMDGKLTDRELANTLFDGLHGDIPVEHRREASSLVVGMYKNARADRDQETLNVFKVARKEWNKDAQKRLVLLAMDHSEDGEVRSNVILLWGRMGGGGCDSVFGLIETVEDDKEYASIREAHTFFLIPYYNNNKIDVRDRLFEYLEHDSESVRNRAQRFLDLFPEIALGKKIPEGWPQPVFHRKKPR